MPPTRAGALALLALLDLGEFTTEPEVTARLRRLTGAHESVGSTAAGTAGDRRRAPPAPHWRYVTRGPIFDANPRRHQWVDGIGWCVRVRVDPERRGEGR